MSDELDRLGRDFESELAQIWRLSLCHCAIQAKIGQELTRRYELSQELPHSMLALLMQMNEGAGQTDRRRDQQKEAGGATPGPSA